LKQTTGVRAELKLRDSLACVNKQKRAEIFAKLKAGNPNPTSELNFRTPFELLVAVVLSAQATDKGVN
jgi:Predicted EndoIII-related endonuclease